MCARLAGQYLVGSSGLLEDGEEGAALDVGEDQAWLLVGRAAAVWAGGQLVLAQLARYRFTTITRYIQGRQVGWGASTHPFEQVDPSLLLKRNKWGSGFNTPRLET